jgi:hypothetical protein
MQQTLSMAPGGKNQEAVVLWLRAEKETMCRRARAAAAGLPIKEQEELTDPP